MRVGGLKFFDFFNSNNFAVINPFLKSEVYQSIVKTAASTLRDTQPSLNSHFCGAWINYKKFNVVDGSLGSLKYGRDCISKIDVFSNMTNPHPALLYLPAWLKDGSYKDKGIEYWMNNAAEYAELCVTECLENGIDPVYVARGAAFRLFFFTMSKGFNKWCLNENNMKIEPIKEIIATNVDGDCKNLYEYILLSDGSKLYVKPTNYPLVLDTLKPSVMGNNKLDEVQYISSVPVDVPLSCFKGLDFEVERLNYYGLKNFYCNRCLKEQEFFNSVEIRRFHFGSLEENILPFSKSIKESISLNYDSNGPSFELNSCGDIVFSII